jgi:hypothetical protein
VEPIFGIIKSVMEFRQFLLQGVEAAQGEWTLVSIAWKEKAGGDIVGFQVGILRKNLFPRLTGGEQLQHVDNADAHASNTGPPTTFPAPEGADEKGCKGRQGRAQTSWRFRGWRSAKPRASAGLESGRLQRPVGRAFPRSVGRSPSPRFRLPFSVLRNRGRNCGNRGGGNRGDRSGAARQAARTAVGTCPHTAPTTPPPHRRNGLAVRGIRAVRERPSPYNAFSGVEPNRNPCGKISWSDRNRMPNRNRMPTSVPSSRLHPTPPSFVLAGAHPPSYTLIERQNAYPVNTPIPCRPRRNATHYGVTV